MTEGMTALPELTGMAIPPSSLGAKPQLSESWRESLVIGVQVGLFLAATAILPASIGEAPEPIGVLGSAVDLGQILWDEQAERNRQLLGLLDRFARQSDEHAQAWWEAFENTLRSNRLKFK